jgi:flagellar hook-associated protein 2
MTGTISSAGIGSGLDVNAIVDKLVSIEHRPIDIIATQQKSVQTKLSSFGLLKNFMANLKDAAAQLADTSLWKSTTTTSSNAAIATATPTLGSRTPPALGSYHLKVANLAQAQTLVSKPVADTKAELGAGSLHIEIGTWNTGATAFTPKADTAAVDIDLADGASSLEAVRDRINAANAGVSATILRDANGARLVVKSSATGEENAVRITASGPAAGDPAPAGLAALAYDPPNAVAGADTLSLAQAGRNAHATINGVDISSASNVLDGAVEGLSISLQKASDDAVEIGVGADTATMKKALSAFVSAYNDIASYIAKETKYDAATKTAGTLQGDASTLQLQKMLRTALSDTSSASSALPRLLDVGIHLGADNTLVLDSTKADKALANPQEMAKAFASRDAASTSGNGFGVRFSDLAAKTLDFEGLLATRTQAMQATISRYQDRQDKMEDLVSQYQARMMKVYTALDTKMSALTAQSNYVTQQMKILANNSSSK